MDETVKEKMGSLLFTTILPFMIMAIFAGILLNFLGVPVWKTALGWGQKLPIFHHINQSQNVVQSNSKRDFDDYKELYLKNIKKLKRNDDQIEQLTQKVAAIKSEKAELLKEIDSKQVKLFQNEMAKQAAIYADMPPSKAAALLEAMPLADASEIVFGMDSDMQSSILSSLKDSNKAAQISMVIKKISTSTDPQSVKEQFHQLALEQESSLSSLAGTLSAMPPAKAATIIQTLASTNFDAAVEAMTIVNIASRPQILAEIQKLDSNMALQLTAALNK